jgi:type II secretory pathway pseudopilin PulG
MDRRAIQMVRPSLAPSLCCVLPCDLSLRGLFLPVQRFRAFTLIEIVLAVFIMMLLLLLAVPSLSGVIANNRLRRSVDSFKNLVRQAQERSVAERRAYLIVLGKDQVFLRPEVLAKDEKLKSTAQIELRRGESVKLGFPAALIKNPPGEWIFWPGGTCEPATIQFKGPAGSWTANYAALTALPEITNYAAR